MLDWLWGRYSWVTLILFICAIVFFFWLFASDKNHPRNFVGLTPLDPNVSLAEILNPATLSTFRMPEAQRLPQLHREAQARPSTRSSVRSETASYPPSPRPPPASTVVTKGRETIDQKSAYDLGTPTTLIVPARQTRNQTIPISSGPTKDLTPAIPEEVLAHPNAVPERATPSQARKFDSYFEECCVRAIEKIYGVPFPSIWADFIRNPETGKNLQLDGYNADLKIGIEAQGKQHYVFPNRYHKTFDEFIKQVRRDEYKVDACDSHGVYLITVPYNVKPEHIEAYIRYYTPEAVSARQQQNQTAVTTHHIL